MRQKRKIHNIEVSAGDGSAAVAPVYGGDPAPFYRRPWPLVGIGVMAVGASVLGRTLWTRMMDARQVAAQKTKQDDQLDNNLSQTMDASDPVSQY